MIQANKLTTIIMEQGNLKVEFLESGDIRKITSDEILINQLYGNYLDGAANNIYLRLYTKAGEIKAYPLLGKNSQSRVSFGLQQVRYTGVIADISYTVTFTLHQTNSWFWQVVLDGGDGEADLLYGQDIGLADCTTVRTNEAYMSQYVDHVIFDDEQKGYVVCSRQNQPTTKGALYLQQGCLQKAIGYSTDGYQFFGKSYEFTNEPEILTHEKLANINYQYEFAYTALATEKFKLGSTVSRTFYAHFDSEHVTAIERLEYSEIIWKAYQEVEKITFSGGKTMMLKKNQKIGKPFASEPFSELELDTYFPEKKQVEIKAGKLYSFFTPDYTHIVLQEKERKVERSHGHIIMTGNNEYINEQTMTSTSYIFGVINAQIALGNTSHNKLLSNTRNSLNLQKISGQRVYVKVDGLYQLLTMPAVYEIGFNYSKWYYKIASDIVTITSYSTVDSPEIIVEIASRNRVKYEYLITHQFVLGTDEYDNAFSLEEENGIFTLQAASDAFSKQYCPNLEYKISIEAEETKQLTDSVFYADETMREASLTVFALTGSILRLSVQGTLNQEKITEKKQTFEKVKQDYYNFYHELTNGMKLSIDNPITKEEIEKMNPLIWWYTHNAMVHYAAPHGLEQYGGAAWGTRDVCQGPAEFFFAIKRFDVVKDIILKVFSHQFAVNGNWPQWFMFDRYHHLMQEESHGDVIVWPLKLIADYLEITDDVDILGVALPYIENETKDFTVEVEPIYKHLQKALKYIKANFIADTKLSSYGEGDWDDTLQPANPKLRAFMASGWTVSLTFQTIKKLSTVLENYDNIFAHELAKLALDIKNDFNTLIIKDNITSGFIYMENPQEVEYLLHPQDKKTGITYRLLPMTRSIIGELFTAEQASKHIDIMERYLNCPDGMRLMDRPAQYQGGVSTYFKRAEQAANVGREVSLQYCHAHIRYIEAMAKIGKTEATWEGLQKITPILIQKHVPHARMRQSNAYFSSSEGAFNDRYEYEKRFSELQAGTIDVKSGWRIYSSGPGIYLNQLISNVLGIRETHETIIIDPVLPTKLDGLKFKQVIAGKRITYCYHLSGIGEQIVVTVNGKKLSGTLPNNQYRQTGIEILKLDIDKLLGKDENIVEIFG